MLVTVIAAVVPLTLVTAKVEMLATVTLDVLLGLVMTGLLTGAANGVRYRAYPPAQQYPAYNSREGYDW